MNDNFGHPAGDEVLKALAKIVQLSVRVVDKPCRYGGDEFIVVLPNATKSDAEVVRDRIQAKIEQHNQRKLCPLFSVSIGIHELSDRDNSPILSLLDHELYNQKQFKDASDIHRLSSHLANSLAEERCKK